MKKLMILIVLLCFFAQIQSISILTDENPLKVLSRLNLDENYQLAQLEEQLSKGDKATLGLNMQTLDGLIRFQKKRT